MRRAVEEIKASRATDTPLNYPTIGRIIKDLSFSEIKQLTDYTVSSYNCIDYHSLGSYYEDFQTMLTAIHSNTGSEYDIKESPENGIVSGGWLNCLGNLVLASQSQNSLLGNKPFVVKLEGYADGVLQQQKEIDSCAETGTDGSKMWTVESIKRRQERIVKWAMANWDVRKVVE